MATERKVSQDARRKASKELTSKVPDTSQKQKCVCCGKVYSPTNFFKALRSEIYVHTGGVVPICKNCLESYFSKLAAVYGNDVALKTVCGIMDWPYVQSAYYAVTVTANREFSLGLYRRQLGMNQYESKNNFVDAVVAGELGANLDTNREEGEVSLTKKDRQNKKFVISVVGYDPYEDMALSEADKRFCFNALAGYCDADGIAEDAHKIQSVIELSLLQLQNKKVNELINQELQKITPDGNVIKKHSETKKNISSAMNTIVKDNNIASAYNSNSHVGRNTLSYKIKEMNRAGFSDAEINLFDVNTASAMKQIADLSNSSILEQLAFDANDYTDIISQQRKLLTELNEKYEKVAEEKRLLFNELQTIKAAKSK